MFVWLKRFAAAIVTCYLAGMEAIRQYFNQLVPLEDAEWQAFAACLTKRTVKRKEKILLLGQVCHEVCFIESGSFRFFHEREDGSEWVTAFFFAGDFVTNYRSVITNQPSSHHIEAMQDAVILSIQKADLFRLYLEFHALDRLGRRIAEGLYLTVAHRLDSFLYESPEERYEALLQRNSRLLTEVPQYMIASYLGVKPETLSRIRARR